MATIQEIHAQIGEKADKLGVDISQLRFKTAIRWFPPVGNLEASFQLDVAAAELAARSIDQKTFVQRRAQIVASTSPVVIRVGDAFPFNPTMRTVAIFGDSQEWRVYALPIKAAGDDPNKPHPGPTCYILNKFSATYDAESMSIDVFISEIVDEWVEAKTGSASREFEKETIVAFLQSLPDDYSIKQAAADIAEDLHLEGDEEEEEGLQEEGQQVEVAAQVVAPAPTEGSNGQAGQAAQQADQSTIVE